MAAIADALLLQKVLDLFQNWCIENSLLIDFDKSKVISFSRGNRLVKVDYFIDSRSLERVKSIHDLGVIYDLSVLIDDQMMTQ